jgi:hypothetical protein
LQQLNAELQAELERATPREVRVPYRQRVAEALLSENRARLVANGAKLEAENALRQLQAEVRGREHGVCDAALARMCTARELQREADAAQEAEIEHAINSREAVVAELMAAVAEHREAELASEQRRANKAEAALAEAEAALAEHEADLAGSQAVELVERQAALEQQAAELAKQQAVELAERQATELAEHQAGLERQAVELAEREAKLAQLEEALATERADRMRLVQELTDARLSAAPAVSQADRSSVREQISLRFAPQTPAMDPNVLVPESQEEADGREPASSRVIVNESQFVQEAGDETEPPPPTPHQQQSDADDAEAEPSPLLSQPFATNASIACAYSPLNGFPLGDEAQALAGRDAGLVGRGVNLYAGQSPPRRSFHVPSRSRAPVQLEHFTLSQLQPPRASPKETAKAPQPPAVHLRQHGARTGVLPFASIRATELHVGDEVFCVAGTTSGGNIDGWTRGFGKRSDGRPVGPWTKGRTFSANPTTAIALSKSIVTPSHDKYLFVQPTDGNSTDAPVYLQGKQVSRAYIEPAAPESMQLDDDMGSPTYDGADPFARP